MSFPPVSIMNNREQVRDDSDQPFAPLQPVNENFAATAMVLKDKSWQISLAKPHA